SPSRSASASGGAAASQATTRSSGAAARNASAAATPERASPTTRYGPGGSWGRSRTDALLVEREADRAADRSRDPEPHDDLGLRPPEQLEVVVDRRHQQDPAAEEPDRDHLGRDRQRLDHEDPADHDQDHLGLRHHRKARDRSPEPE